MRIFLLFLSLLFVVSCHNSQKAPAGENGAFKKEKQVEGDNVNRIVDSGELIVATLSGPDTYFEYQDKGFGLQYALASNYAESLGVALRVEVCSDTLQLLSKLERGDVDLVALQIPENAVKTDSLSFAGAYSTDKNGRKSSWVVKKDMADLAESLDDWFGDGVEVEVEKAENQRLKQRLQVRRHVHAPFISKEKGVISTYDTYFKEAAHAVGWDWRLVAAQCYQESGFDPNAVSWAGASGLMQLMPSTAAQMGLKKELIFKPAENIAAATRYISHLQNIFKSVPDPMERIMFVLGAYNAGPGHIQDAQALARKYGRNANSWSDVSQFVRGLSQAKYYRDPVVHHGYMIGSETYGYVQSIVDRWQAYGGGTYVGRAGAPMRSESVSTIGETSQREHKRNRFSREHKLLSPEELQKQSTQ